MFILLTQSSRNIKQSVRITTQKLYKVFVLFTKTKKSSPVRPCPPKHLWSLMTKLVICSFYQGITPNKDSISAVIVTEYV